MITGLLCKPEPQLNEDDLPPSELWKKYFPYHEKVTKIDLLSTFKSKELIGPDINMVRLAIHNCMENLLIGGQKNVQTSILNWRLVEEMDLFNDFPWGTVSFK